MLRSGLCVFSRKCLPMREVGTMLPRVTARVWCESQGLPGLCTQSLALHHCAGGLVTQVPPYSFLGGPRYMQMIL